MKDNKSGGKYCKVPPEKVGAKIYGLLKNHRVGVSNREEKKKKQAQAEKRNNKFIAKAEKRLFDPGYAPSKATTLRECEEEWQDIAERQKARREGATNTSGARVPEDLTPTEQEVLSRTDFPNSGLEEELAGLGEFGSHEEFVKKIIELSKTSSVGPEKDAEGDSTREGHAIVSCPSPFYASLL